MTEREKMLAGELYYAQDPDLAPRLMRAKGLSQEYNQTPRSDTARQREIMHSLLGGHGERFHFEPNVWFDYGFNTFVGENFYSNNDCVFIDCNTLTFGDNVMIGPQCGFYTAGHPLDYTVRRKELEFAKPIRVGNDVWIGGGVRILPGVTVGDRVVIGAGSVVTHDVPSDCVVAGNPARILRKL